MKRMLCGLILILGATNNLYGAEQKKEISAQASLLSALTPDAALPIANALETAPTADAVKRRSRRGRRRAHKTPSPPSTVSQEQSELNQIEHTSTPATNAMEPIVTSAFFAMPVDYTQIAHIQLQQHQLIAALSHQVAMMHYELRQLQGTTHWLASNLEHAQIALANTQQRLAHRQGPNAMILLQHRVGAATNTRSLQTPLFISAAVASEQKA